MELDLIFVAGILVAYAISRSGVPSDSADDGQEATGQSGGDGKERGGFDP